MAGGGHGAMQDLDDVARGSEIKKDALKTRFRHATDRSGSFRQAVSLEPLRVAEHQAA
jgi:hypothetical protein